MSRKFPEQTLLQPIQVSGISKSKLLHNASWNNVVEKIFVRIKISRCHSPCLQVCTDHERFALSSILKVETLRMISFDPQGWKSYLCETAVKTVTQLALYKKNWSAFSAVTKVTVFYIKDCLVCTKRLFVKNWKVSVTVIKRGLENLVNINFYACDLYYLTRTIFNMPDFLCACVGAYEYDCAYHLGRPECQN